MCKITQAHAIATDVLAIIYHPKQAHMLALRCGPSVIECLECDAKLALRMQSDEGSEYCLKKLRFWLKAARNQIMLIPLVDETPEEAVNKRAMWTL